MEHELPEIIHKFYHELKPTAMLNFELFAAMHAIVNRTLMYY